MKKSKKFLTMVFFIVFLSFIFTVLILAPKITFAEVSEEAGSETKININTATQEELVQLKGIGEDLAKRVIEYREQNGPFEKIEDITKVKGLGEKFLEENNAQISIGEEVIEEAKPDIHVE